MEGNKRNARFKMIYDELSLAIHIPTNQRKRLHLSTNPHIKDYDPQTEEDMTDGHKQLRKILDYFETKASTNTIFGDHALRVFSNIDRHLYSIWQTKIEVTMKEVFPILDELRYGHDTIALLSIVSPSSYRLLYQIPKDDEDPPIPTFTLESGMVGPPLKRRPDLEGRKETFLEEATKATRDNETTRFKAFFAAQIQANFHGSYITRSGKPTKRVFWKLDSSTPNAGQLDMDYMVLALMKDAPSMKSKICIPGNEVIYDSNTRAWYTDPKPELQPKPKRVKVSEFKKREDARKRMIKHRLKKKAGKNSFRTITNLSSGVEFYRESRSRSSSIRKPSEAITTKTTSPLTRSQHSQSVRKTHR